MIHKITGLFKSPISVKRRLYMLLFTSIPYIASIIVVTALHNIFTICACIFFTLLFIITYCIIENDNSKQFEQRLKDRFFPHKHLLR